MKRINIFLIISIMTLAAISAEAADTERLAAKAVKIQFLSIGTGVDPKPVDQVMILIKNQEQRGLIQSVSKKPWGREGEFDLCIQYHDFSVAADSDRMFTVVTSEHNSPIHVERVLDCKNP